MRMKTLWCALIAVGLMIPFGAWAQGEEAAEISPEVAAANAAQAKQLYAAGSEAYSKGRYELAIESFRAARDLTDRPAVIFGLAQAYRLQYFVDGDPEKLAEAVKQYRDYMAKAPEGARRDHAAGHLATLTPILERRRAEGSKVAATAESKQGRLIISSNLKEARARVDGGDPQDIPAAFTVKPGPHKVQVEAPGHLTQTLDTVAVAGSPVALAVKLQPLPGRLTVVAPEGAKVSVDGRLLGKAPLAGEVPLAAGRHVLAVIERGHDPYVEQLSVDRGVAIKVEASLETSTQRVTAWSLFGAAGALGVGTGLAWLSAADKEDEAQALERQLDTSGLTPAEVNRYNELESDRNSRRDLAVGLGAAAAGALITAALLWYFDTPEAPRGPAYQAPVQPAPTGDEVAVGP